MIGMTLCSGIGAPEMAAPWIDWRFASEVEAFPREVLRQRFGYQLPEEHNQGDPLLWGDMTEVTPDLLRARGIPLPDLIVAGTPCQSFSLAGLRKGTLDDRGNLTLKFVEIVHAIVDARPDGKLAVVWENVPGILSDRGNAFGNFLGGLVGGDDPCLPGECPPEGKSNDFWKWHKGGKIELRDEDDEPTGEFEIVEPHHRPKWPGVGMVAGPLGRAAWATLDAQWFGVAQRRRRVFVVVDFGGACDPAAVLFEPKGLCGNSAPSREKGEGVAATLEASTGGVSGKDDPQGRVVSSSHWGESEVHPSLNQSHNTGGIGASNQEVFSQGGAGLVPAQVGFRMAAFGEYSDDETASTLKQRDFKDATDLVAFDCKGTEVQSDTDVHPPLRSMGHMDSHSNAGGHVAIAIQERAVSENIDAGPDGAGFRDDDTAYTLEARQTPQAVAFAQNQRDEVRTMEVAGALAAEPGMKQQTYLAVPAEPETSVYSIMPQNSGKDYKAREVDVAQPLMAGGPVGGNQGGDYVLHPPSAAYDLRGRDDGAQLEGPHDTAALRAASGGSSRSYVSTPAVRRLTPVECARLQGFPIHEAILRLSCRCSDLPKNPAPAGDQSPKSQNNVQNAHDQKFNQSVRSAGKIFLSVHLDHERLVGANVRMSFGPKAQDEPRIKKSPSSAKDVGPSDVSLRLMLSDNTVRQLVHMMTELESQTASKKSGNNFTIQEDGKRFAIKFGREIKPSAENAERDIGEVGRCSTYIISPLGPDTQKIAWTPTTSFFSAVSAIIGCIPETIPIETSLEIEIARVTSHCAVTYRGKPAADGPQYKAYGNSMAIPCVAWILDRIGGQKIA